MNGKIDAFTHAVLPTVEQFIDPIIKSRNTSLRCKQFARDPLVRSLLMEYRASCQVALKDALKKEGFDA